MPYSKSLRSVEDMKKFLDDLVEANERNQGVAWEVPSGSARRISWKIREAFYAIRENKDNAICAPYVQLPAVYKVSERNSSSVVARIRAPGAIRRVLIDEGFSSQEASAIAARKGESTEAHAPNAAAVANRVDELLTTKRERALTCGGDRDHFGIITAWTENKSASKLSFPDVDTTSGILLPLWRWAQKQVPPIILIVAPSGTGLVLMLWDEEMKDYAWTPGEN